MTPLIFVPGMMCDARLFTDQIVHFSRGRTVSIASLVGNNSIEEIAEKILVQAPPSFALCGLSMGGIVAMEIVRQMPERVDRLALIDTNYLPDNDKGRAIRLSYNEEVREGGLERIMRDQLKPRYLADGPNRKAALDLCMEMALDLGPEVFIDQSIALMKRRDQTDTLKNLDIPSTIICGAEDSLCPVKRHEEMAALITYSHLKVLKSTGHLPPLEQPEETTELLQEWLER